MSDSVSLQSIVDKYRQQLDEVNYQLICHKILVEQKNEEINGLKARVASLTDNLPEDIQNEN